MPNRSTHQLPQVTSTLAGDRGYLVREGPPGTWSDKSFDISLLGLPLLVVTTTIQPVDVFILDSAGSQIVPAPAADKIIVPRVIRLSFLGWTTPWTATDLIVGSGGLINPSRYFMKGPSETGGDTAIITPTYLGQLTSVLAGDSLWMMALATMTGGDAAIAVTTYYHLIDA